MSDEELYAVDQDTLGALKQKQYNYEVEKRVRLATINQSNADQRRYNINVGLTIGGLIIAVIGIIVANNILG